MKNIIEWFNGLKDNGSHLNNIDKILYDIDDNKGLEIEDAVAQIISKIKDLSNEEHPTEVVIQPDKPTNNPNARLWVKTPTNNNNFDEVGNGLLYYRDNNSNWKEVSAIWTPTPDK